MALMFLNGGGMRGGPVHRHINGVPLVGERQTAPRYRFYSIRDEYPGLYPADRARADGRCHVDVGFWGGAIPGNGAQLGPLHEGGVIGFKCFLLPSGVEEFPPLGPAELKADLDIVAALGSQMIVHAEDPQVIERAPDPGGRGYGTFLRSRPGDAEDLAIGLVLDLARRTGARVHILHLSSASSFGQIRAARAGGPGHGRDLPALPGLHRRGDPRRRDAVQVLPADPGGGQSGASVVRAGRRHDRLRGVRPFALHAGPEAAGDR